MKIIGVILTLFMLGALFGAIFTFPAMLLIGAAHSYDPRIPALGFRGLFLLGMGLRFLLTGIASSSSSS